MKRLFARLGLAQYISRIIRLLNLQPIVHIVMSMSRPDRNYQRELQMVQKVLATIPHEDGASNTWIAKRVIPTLNDVAVVLVGPQHKPPAAVMKLASSANAHDRVLERGQQLAQLHADARLATWHPLIPKPIYVGQVDEYAYQLQSLVEGVEVTPYLNRTAIRERVQSWGVQFTTDLLRQTGTPTVVDEALLSVWVDQPCLLIRKVMTESGYMSAEQAEYYCTRLMTELRQKLANLEIMTSWAHGDLMPENILVADNGQRVSGVVDWELSTPNGLPYLDLLFLFLSIRTTVERREFGDVVGACLQGKAWQPHEQALLEQAREDQLDNRLDSRTLLLLCWLHHISTNLSKSGHYAQHGFWLLNNVDSVLRGLGAAQPMTLSFWPINRKAHPIRPPFVRTRRHLPTRNPVGSER